MPMETPMMTKPGNTRTMMLSQEASSTSDKEFLTSKPAESNSSDYMDSQPEASVKES